MDTLPTIAVGILLAVFGTIATRQLNGRFDELKTDRRERSAAADRRLERLEDKHESGTRELRTEIKQLEGKIDARFGRIDEALALLRSDVLHVATAVGAERRNQAG
jgi:TolA-binding protein